MKGSEMNSLKTYKAGNKRMQSFVLINLLLEMLL